MAFNKYAAGRKVYGGGRDAPNIGPVGGDGVLGYKTRDLQLQARKNAMLRRLKAQQSGNYMSPDWLRSKG
jgi:hypothetical protein